MVLTDKGLVPIENLTKAHKLWDGENWVSHDGVIYKGIGEVIEYDGLRATKDHIVWIEGQEKPIQFGEAATSGAHLLQSGDGRRAIWVGEDYKPRKKMGEKLEFLLCPHKMSRLWKHSMARQGKLNNRKVKRMSSLLPAKTNSTMVGQKANSSKAKVYQPKRSRVQKLWRKRNKIQVFINSRGRSLFNRKIWIAKKRTRNRQNRQQWALRKRQLKICDSYRECSNKRNTVLTEFHQKYWPYARSVVIRKLSKGLSREEIIEDAELAVFEKRKNWKGIEARLDFMIYEMPERITVLPYQGN